MAAATKNYTIESLVKTISELTNTNSALTTTIKKLANQLERAQSKNGWSENNGASSGGASSGGANNRKGNPNHIKEATRQNTMGGSKEFTGFGNTPNGK